MKQSVASSKAIQSASVPPKRDIGLALASITKQFGAGSIMRLGDSTALCVDVQSTGSLAVDTILGVGGLPRGRIIELFGPEASGKTTLCLSIIAAVQKRGGTAGLIDVEHALDPKWAGTCGVNINDLLVSQPDCGEDALTIMETLIRSNAIDVVVLDSVAALITRNELEGQMGDASMGSQARLMSQAMRRLTAAVSKSKCLCIFTNQIREKIGVMFGNPETTSGGKALKFFASVRLDVRRKDQIKQTDGTILGNRCKVKVVKNKVAAPFGEAEFDILFNEGVSNAGTLIDMGVEHEILEKKGAWIAYNGELVGQGREAAKQYLKDKPEFADKLETEIRQKTLKKMTIDATAPVPELTSANPITLPTNNEVSFEMAEPVEKAV